MSMRKSLKRKQEAALQQQLSLAAQAKAELDLKSPGLPTGDEPDILERIKRANAVRMKQKGVRSTLLSALPRLVTRPKTLLGGPF
jgi:hypothetical protein